MWKVLGVRALSLHFLQREKDSGSEKLRMISRFTSVLPPPPKSGWVGFGVGSAAGKAAHSPAPALAPDNAASPSPSPLSRGLLGSRRQRPPLPSPFSARPQQQQALCAAAGGMRWGRGLGQALGVGRRQGLRFGKQGSRPENLGPLDTHTQRHAGVTRVRRRTGTPLL